MNRIESNHQAPDIMQVMSNTPDKSDIVMQQKVYIYSYPIGGPEEQHGLSLIVRSYFRILTTSNRTTFFFLVLDLLLLFEDPQVVFADLLVQLLALPAIGS